MSNETSQHSAPLAGTVAIVTGGTGGIGNATCRCLAGAGANVVIVDRSKETVSLLQQELSAGLIDGQQVAGLVLNVTDEADMEEMARLTLEQFGRIDLLITCAGILRAPGSLPKPMAQVDSDEWDIVINVNLKGVFLSNKAVLPAMMAQREGSIINLASTSGRQGKAHDSAYCASKFGVIGLSESLAEVVRPYGIKVQTVLPDAVDTPLWEQNGPIKPEHALAPERVGELILMMAMLPADTILVAPVIAPFRTRRRKKAAATQAEPQSAIVSDTTA